MRSYELGGVSEVVFKVVFLCVEYFTSAAKGRRPQYRGPRSDHNDKTSESLRAPFWRWPTELYSVSQKNPHYLTFFSFLAKVENF